MWRNSGSEIMYNSWLNGEDKLPARGKCIGLYAGDAKWTMLDKSVMRPFICEL
jgi:hypothetical protein